MSSPGPTSANPSCYFCEHASCADVNVTAHTKNGAKISLQFDSCFDCALVLCSGKLPPLKNLDIPGGIYKVVGLK